MGAELRLVSALLVTTETHELSVAVVILEVPIEVAFLHKRFRAKFTRKRLFCGRARCWLGVCLHVDNHRLPILEFVPAHAT